MERKTLINVLIVIILISLLVIYFGILENWDPDWNDKSVSQFKQLKNLFGIPDTQISKKGGFSEWNNVMPFSKIKVNDDVVMSNCPVKQSCVVETSIKVDISDPISLLIVLSVNKLVTYNQGTKTLTILGPSNEVNCCVLLYITNLLLLSEADQVKKYVLGLTDYSDFVMPILKGSRKDIDKLYKTQVADLTKNLNSIPFNNTDDCNNIFHRVSFGKLMANYPMVSIATPASQTTKYQAGTLGQYGITTPTGMQPYTQAPVFPPGLNFVAKEITPPFDESASIYQNKWWE